MHPRSALGEPITVALYHTSLARPGPGLLLRDIVNGKDEQVDAVVQVVNLAAPDILVLLDVDYDHDLVTLKALRDRIASKGIMFPHVFALAPNTGVATGLDLDEDSRTGGPRDAQGYGQFAGQGGMALLSQYPVEIGNLQDFTTLLWRDLPDASLTLPTGEPVLSPDVLAEQRLSTTGHWVLPLQVRGQILWLLAFHATPPVFDGPNDRNGRRNHDEARFWTHYLNEKFGPRPDTRFIIIGDSNMDTSDSEGRPEAMQALLTDPRLQDPLPKGGGAWEPTDGHLGDPALDTARWPDPGPGNFRVDYILPSSDLKVLGARVFWPPPDDPMAEVARRASRHYLVSVSLEWPPAAAVPRD